jgi:hypothetical protein
LVLIAGWIVTLGAVAYKGPKIFYAAEGGSLLACYFVVLALPLIVVVPLAAFRSLAAEREDNTYDLLSITALKPRQIISGKLGSSVAQMTVYLSAITPCLAFTYLLRGVDLPTIGVLLVYTFFWSLGLSMAGILLATLTPQRFLQIFILVLFVAALFINLYGAVAMSIAAALYGRAVVWGIESQFWLLTLGLATSYASFFALAYYAAAGMITFTSENRSTPLRICMLVQQALLVAWMSYFWIASSYSTDPIFATMVVSAMYWYAMGTLLTSERAGISQRVRRGLPQSFFGRMFFSWLTPGPATGYMFVIASGTSIALLCFVAAFASDSLSTRAGSWPYRDDLLYLAVVGWGYVVGYLGIGLLVVSALRRIATVTMLASVLIHFLLLLAGYGIPYAIKSMSLDLRDADYSFLQLTDPFNSLTHIAEGGSFTDANVIALTVPGIAVCILLLNVPRVIRELRVVREAPPPRVLRDEAELHPAPAALPQNPWEE